LIGEEKTTLLDENNVDEGPVPYCTYGILTGPWSHLINGAHDLAYVGHVAQFAACLGEYAAACRKAPPSTNKKDAMRRRAARRNGADGRQGHLSQEQPEQNVVDTGGLTGTGPGSLRHEYSC
jgi:hypothetical protein